MMGTPFFGGLANSGGGLGGLPPALLMAMNGGASGTTAGSAPGSMAPQIPTLPSRAPGGTPGVNIPSAPQPPQSNMLSSLGAAGLSKLFGGNGAGSLLRTGMTPGLSNSGSLFGGAGPIFGGPLQGPTASGATLDTTGPLGSNGFFANMFGGAGAATNPLAGAGLADMGAASSITPAMSAGLADAGAGYGLLGAGAAGAGAAGAAGAAAAAPALAGGIGDIGALLASNPELFALA